MCSGLSGSLEQRVVAQVDHAGGEVVAGAPVGVNVPQLFGRQGGDLMSHDDRPWFGSDSSVLLRASRKLLLDLKWGGTMPGNDEGPRCTRNHDVVAECDVFKFKNVDFGRRPLHAIRCGSVAWVCHIRFFLISPVLQLWLNLKVFKKSKHYFIR